MNKAKLIIIYGDNKVDGKNRNGEIECLGDINSDDLHISCLLDFFQKNFLDENIFKKINYTTIPETVGYILTEKSHIVFFNTTKLGKGKSGFFMMPTNISENQKNSLKQLSNFLDDFNIRILYDYFINSDGLLDSKSISTNNDCPIIELFNIYFQKNENNKKM